MVPDFAEDSTIRLGFVSTAPDGTPTAPSAAFTAADFAIYKDGSATQKTTTNGITVTSPFDSITGRHLISIDTSNDTGDAGFWAAGSVYEVVLSTAKTVDSKSVSGYSVGEFRLGGVRIDSASVTAVQSGLSVLDEAGVRTAVGMASANLDTQLGDLPTVAEFEARTILASAYFDPASDTVANVTTVGSVSGSVTVGTNNDKTDYALSEASRDAIIADFLAHVITKGSAGTIERAFWQAAKAQASASGEVSGTPTASAFDTDLTGVTGAFDHLLIVFTSGSLTGEARPIDTYVSANGRITLQEALTAAPAAADEFIIVPSHVHKISDIQNGLSTDTAVAEVYDLAAWLLTASVGSISNAQSAAESFELILGGVTYTVTGSGMTETGNRSTTTLSKV